MLRYSLGEFKPTISVPGHGPVQHSLKEIEYLKSVISNVIEVGEKLKSENISDDDALEKLMEIEGYREAWDDMKKDTLKQWYSKIKN